LLAYLSNPGVSCVLAFFPAALGFRPAPARLPPRAMFGFLRVLNDFKKNNHTPARPLLGDHADAVASVGIPYRLGDLRLSRIRRPAVT
jgi:hypothetical protein